MSRVDPYAVCGVCLRDALRPIVEQEQRRRTWRHGGGQLTGRIIDQAGVIKTISGDSGVHQRRILSVLKAEFATVSVHTADALFTALERTDLMHTLEVFRRPIGRRVGDPGAHVCGNGDYGCHACGGSLDVANPSCVVCVRRAKLRDKSAAACRVAAVEPSPTKSAPASGSDSQTRRAA